MQQPAHQEKPVKSEPATPKAAAHVPANLGTRDLRSTLEWLRAQGDLIETEKAVDPDLEVTGLQKHMDGGCPVLFNNVKGKPNHRVITNLFGDMNVINKMFGWKNDIERTRKIAAGLPQAAQAGDHSPGARRRCRSTWCSIRRTSTSTWCRSGTRPTRPNSPSAPASAASASTSSMAAPTSATTA